MSDYTPTTEEVRDQWVWNYPDYDNEREAFDRWFAGVKAQERQLERERIIALLESKLMGKAVEDFTGEIGWSSFNGDVIALIKGEVDA